MTEPTPIWQLKTYNIQGLVNALTADDLNIRRRAIIALRKLRATDAIPALQKALMAETDAENQALIGSVLETLGAEQTPSTTSQAAPDENSVNVSQLVEQLNDEDSDVVVAAARGLGDAGDKMAVSALVLLFNDAKRSIHVRLAVAEALLKLESAPAQVALLANLRHTDWHIRRNGAAILGQLRAEWAIQPLASAINDAHPTVRRTARAALKYIGTPEARKALAQESHNTALQPIKPSTSPLSDTEALRRQQAANDEDDAPVEAPRTGLLQRIDPQEQSTRETDTRQDAASTNSAPTRAAGNTKPLPNIDLDAYRPKKKTPPSNE